MRGWAANPFVTAGGSWVAQSSQMICSARFPGVAGCSRWRKSSHSPGLCRVLVPEITVPSGVLNAANDVVVPFRP